MLTAQALMLTTRGLSKKQTKAATSSQRKRKEAELPDWEKPSDQTVWSSSIKSGLKGYETKLAKVCRLLRRHSILLMANDFLLFSTFRAKFCCCRNPGVASGADFQQNWLTQRSAADVAVVRVRWYL